MKNILSFQRAVQSSLILFRLLIAFHLLVILDILLLGNIPIDYLWGGRMETSEQLLNFEIISLLGMVMCLVIVLIRSEKIRVPSLMGPSRVALWVLSILFLANTLGNLLAKTTFEKCFALITALLVILCVRLALEKVQHETVTIN